MGEVAGVSLYLCDAANTTLAALQAHCTGWLDAAERERLARFRAEPQARLFVVGRILLRRQLAQRLGCAPAALRFRLNPAGKPQLDGEHAGALDFNLSHTGTLLALAISSAGPVGVDIDSHGRRNRIDALARRFCSPREQALLARLPEAEQRHRFMEMWALKEAFLKARGRGMEWPLSHFSGLPGEHSLEVHHSDCDLAGTCMWLYRHWPQHPLACMVLGETATPTLWQCSLDGARQQTLAAQPLSWAGVGIQTESTPCPCD